MAADSSAHSDKSIPMSTAELVAFTQQELDKDAKEREAKLQAAGAAGLPRQSQEGVTLDLGNKTIEALPVEVIELIKDRVERLALSHNAHRTLPIEFGLCKGLRYLNLRWNRLAHFPDALCELPKLEILDMSRNKITSIPEEVKKMTSLKFLAVSSNRITRLPLAIGEMNTLIKLKLDSNPIEFPPPDVCNLAGDTPVSSIEFDRDREACQRVKRYLKATAMRQKLRTNSEEELNESNAETPRPPKRSATFGRFPIRPSVSGIESFSDPKSDSPPDPTAPPVPIRSHARILSTNAPPNVKRPGPAPLAVGGNDISRSRSETVASSASLRQRRQGWLHPRKVTGDLNIVSEGPGPLSARTSQASTIKPMHSRDTSTASTLNGSFTASSGETSSGALSPIEGPHGRLWNARRLSNLPENRNSKVQPSDAVKGSKRLLLTLYQLQRPISDVALAVKDGTPKRTALERRLFSAHAQVEELDRQLRKLENGSEDGNEKTEESMRSVVKISLEAVKTYGAVATELRRNTANAVKLADGIYIRSLMFQIYGAMVEARNICTIVGMKVKPSRDTPRLSKAWSSKTVTPTQPKPPINRRVRGATALSSIGSAKGLGVMPPPPVPLNTSVSRMNNMTSMGAPTPRSGDSFATLPHINPNMSRSNTMRSIPDEADGGDQFDLIFSKLGSTCDLARQALPQCREEFERRKNNAQSAGHNIHARQWSIVQAKCDDAITKNRELRKRMGAIRLNDPGVRYQKDFWQLCDAFVHSYTALVTEIKDLGTQRVDISMIKGIMRQVQRHVKDVSNTISRSPLYHQALGTKSPDSAGPQSLAPPFPSGLSTSFAAHGGSGTHSGYVTPLPATPLSAALGPAAQAVVASTSNAAVTPRDTAQELQASRSAHERNDTVIQQPRQPRRQ